MSPQTAATSALNNTEYRPTASLEPYGNNARVQAREQVRQISASITQFGFNNPALIGSDGEISLTVAGLDEPQRVFDILTTGWFHAILVSIATMWHYKSW